MGAVICDGYGNIYLLICKIRKSSRSSRKEGGKAGSKQNRDDVVERGFQRREEVKRVEHHKEKEDCKD